MARQGGHLVRLLNGRIPGTASLGLTEARDRARAYLEAAGFANMEPSFGEVADGAATIQYVHRQGETLVYPDQVKVTVALDTGEVVGGGCRRIPDVAPGPDVAGAAAQLRGGPGGAA